MHDLSLGGPVEAERDSEATHKGPCLDGVYGCHRCWNSANDGKGTISTCDACGTQDVHTRVVRAIDEPVMYAACEACEARRQRALAELERELDDDWRDEEGRDR